MIDPQSSALESEQAKRLRSSPGLPVTPGDDGKLEGHRNGIVYRVFSGAGQIFRSFRAHPVWGVVLGLFVFVLAYAGTKALDFVHGLAFGPDEFLAQIAEDQKKEFDALHGHLDALQRSLQSGDRAAFRAVEDAVKSVETTNRTLLQQLALAKEENDTLRQAAAQGGGAPGGYEFILSEGQGVRIDNSTAIGFNSYNGGAAGLIRISLTSKDESKQLYLDPGGSVSYVSSDGKNCRIALLTVRGERRNHAASFTRLCGDPAPG